MVLEYLFLEDKANKDEIKQFVNEKIKKCEVTPRVNPYVEDIVFDNSNILVIKCEVKSNNVNNAKFLSELNAIIISNYQPTVLRNDASAYFNEHLFPLVSKFERLLRQLLYFKNAVYDGAKVKKVIENLESKDFGTIFNLLFIDEEYCKKAKEKVTQKQLGHSGVFTKADILRQLSEIDEDTTWDKIIGNTLNYVRDHFPEIREYRNDVMHAHNIDYDTYIKAKNVFTKSLNSLENEVAQYIKYPDTHEKAGLVVETLSDRLETFQKRAETVEDSLIKVVTFIQKMSEFDIKPEMKDNFIKFLDFMSDKHIPNDSNEVEQ